MIATSEQLGKNFDDLLTEACKVHLCVCMHFEPVPRDSLGYSAVYTVACVFWKLSRVTTL